jgi:hypothetical protein
MTTLNDDDLKKIERALADAHRSRQTPLLGADWSFRVMRDIRREAGAQGPWIRSLGLDRLVWRTAAVAAVLALVFTGSVFLYINGEAVDLTALLSGEFDATVPLE